MPAIPPSFVLPSEKELQHIVRQNERRIKSYNCEHSMINIALFTFLNPNADPSDVQYSIQLCERAIKQHNSSLAMNVLAQHFYFNGIKQQKLRVIPLLEASLNIQPTKRALYFLAKALFYGNFGQTDQLRGINLLRRALSMDQRDCITMGSLAKMCLLYPHPEINKKEALQLFQKVIEIGQDPYHMRQLEKLYATGTPVLKACERRRLIWKQRAEQLEQDGVVSSFPLPHS
eukprot:TRINITY_DN62_c0_g1_i3.p1 TRINITY_DN62_c0_g1~~TRINITY_DN62_c0_g1_i3.p1  ORF type:complete len:231 (+),score=38.25 TRINITY_DN62_c0_g1_i3:2631-3323(+)